MQFSDIISQATIYKFSPDSSYFAYCDGSKIYIKQCSIQCKNASIINTPGIISDFLFSPNSKHIAIYISKKAMIYIYSIQGKLCAKIQDSQAGIIGMLWAKDSVQLLSFSDYMYKCSIYNLADSSVTYIKNPKIGNSKGCSFSSDGKFLALLQRHQCKDYLNIYYTVDWKVVNSFQVDLFDAIEVKWAPNDANILVWDNCINYKMLVFCPMRGQIAKFQPYDYALGIKCVQFSHNSLFVAIGSYDEKIRILNALTWKLIIQLDCSVTVQNPNAIKIYKEDDISKLNNRIKLIDGVQYKIPTMKVVSSQKSPPNQGVSMIEFSIDDRYIACKNDNMPFTVWIWQTSKLQINTIISLGSHIKMAKWSKDSNTLCIVSGTDRLLYWKDDAILECQFPYENRKFNIQKIKWSQDFKRMLMSDRTDLVYAEVSGELA